MLLYVPMPGAELRQNDMSCEENKLFVILYVDRFSCSEKLTKSVCWASENITRNSKDPGQTVTSNSNGENDPRT